MKCLVVLIIAFVALVAADDEWKPIPNVDELVKIREECKKEDGVIPGLNEDDPREKRVRIDSICPVLKMGVFSLDKGFDVERILAQYKALHGSDRDVRDIVVGCIARDEKDSSITSWAYSAEQCLSRKFKESGEKKDD